MFITDQDNTSCCSGSPSRGRWLVWQRQVLILVWRIAPVVRSEMESRTGREIFPPDSPWPED